MLRKYVFVSAAAFAAMALIFAGCNSAEKQPVVTPVVEQAIDEAPAAPDAVAEADEVAADVTEAVADVKEEAAPAVADATPAMVMLDLSKLFNGNAVVQFDEWENSYPVRGMPARQVVADMVRFTFGPFTRTANNMVTADGQTIPASGKFSKLHIVTAAANGNQNGAISLVYGDQAAGVEVAFPDWCASVAGKKALVTLDRVTKHEAAKCSLFIVEVPVDPARELKGITLPKNSNIKIFAATLTK